MAHVQDPRPVEKLKSNATVAQRIAKINELVDLVNSMWFTDDADHTE
jgi:hypothetical protein